MCLKVMLQTYNARSQPVFAEEAIQSLTIRVGPGFYGQFCSESEHVAHPYILSGCSAFFGKDSSCTE